MRFLFLGSIAMRLDEDNHSLIGVTRQRVAGEFVRCNEEPG